MAKYIVQGEPYFDGTQAFKPGEVVTLPDSGPNCAPVPGWLKEDGTPVKLAHVKSARAEHKKAMDALAGVTDEDVAPAKPAPAKPAPTKS